ncbi:polysaccharide deacetylase family protein [Rhodanobacter sp. BL-MT-08]
MLITEESGIERPGIRTRLGEFCYRTGLLRIMQKARALARQDLRILAYHRVLTVPDTNAFDFDLDLVSASAAKFREQMLLLKRHFHPTALSDVVAALKSGKRLPVNAVVITFDDGYDDNYRVAYPILREFDIPATFFVSTGHVESGQPFAYDWLVHMILAARVPRLVLPELGIDVTMPSTRTERRELARQVLRIMKSIAAASQSALITRLEKDWQMPRDRSHPDCRPISWNQLREMHAAGFEIGSHGVHHHMLAKLPYAEMVGELVQSRVAIARELGMPAQLLSYPVGGDLAFDEPVMAAAEAAGYLAACSYICGTNPRSVPNRFALYRLPVEHVMSLGWFAAMLTLPELMGYPTVSRAHGAAKDSACSP